MITVKYKKGEYGLDVIEVTESAADEYKKWFKADHQNREDLFFKLENGNKIRFSQVSSIEYDLI